MDAILRDVRVPSFEGGGLLQGMSYAPLSGGVLGRTTSSGRSQMVGLEPAEAAAPNATPVTPAAGSGDSGTMGCRWLSPNLPSVKTPLSLCHNTIIIKRMGE